MAAAGTYDDDDDLRYETLNIQGYGMHRRLTNKFDTMEMAAEMHEQRSSRILNRSKSLDHKLEAERVNLRPQKSLDIQKQSRPGKSPVPRHMQKSSGSPPRLSQKSSDSHLGLSQLERSLTYVQKSQEFPPWLSQRGGKRLSKSGPWGLSIVIPNGSCDVSPSGTPKAELISTPVLLRRHLTRAHTTTPFSSVTAWLAQAIPKKIPAIERIEPDSQILQSIPFSTSSILSLVLGFLHSLMNVCTALLWVPALFLRAVCSPDPPWQQQVATPEANEVRERQASHGSPSTPTCNTGFWLSLQAYAGDCFSP